MDSGAGLVPDRTVVVIAAFNEQATLGEVVREVRATGATVVVVDDGSNDATSAAATSAQAIVLRHAVNLGQGAALATGLRFATAQLQPRVVVTFDADGQHRAEDLLALIDPIVSDRADVALGSRFAAGGGASGIPRFRRFLLRFAARSARRLYGIPLTDSHNGLRALSPGAGALVAERLTQARMAHASELVALVCDSGLRVVEVPVTVRYTPYSLAKGQRLRHALSVLWDLIGPRLLRP